MIVKAGEICLFYEKVGCGQPLILVHGNGETHHIFDRAVDILKNSYTVYTFDSRGHGESTLGELNYEKMAHDYVLAIKELKIEKPVFFGFSDGGIIGLMIALEENNLLFKLVIAGANIFPAGLSKGCRFKMSINYFFNRDDKLRLMLREPYLKFSDLKRITIPTYILAGQHDIVSLEHTKKINENIADSKMMIMKNHDHSSYVMNEEVLTNVLFGILEE